MLVWHGTGSYRGANLKWINGRRERGCMLELVEGMSAARITTANMECALGPVNALPLEDRRGVMAPAIYLIENLAGAKSALATTIDCTSRRSLANLADGAEKHIASRSGWRYEAGDE